MGSMIRPLGARAAMAEAKTGAASSTRHRSSRTILLVGPYLSGKTRLLDAILERTGSITRPVKSAAPVVGDASPEARAHGMSVELTVATTEYLGDSTTFIDCPGSVEFQHEAATALAVADAAVVVFEPDPKRIPALQVILKTLEDLALPHILFINKIDMVSTPVREILALVQSASRLPLVLRQIPIWENGIATGFVDLALERAFVYREHAQSVVIDMPAAARDREKDARFTMLERLADYDDALMEHLLSDIEPPRDQIFDDLARELADGLICPVLLGSAGNGNGIGRLLKAIRHEVPSVTATARRLAIPADRAADGAIVHIFKTQHTGHGGKLSIGRVLAGEITDGAELAGPNGGERVSGLYSMLGTEAKKVASATAGDTIGLGRLDRAQTGDTLVTRSKTAVTIAASPPPPPVYGTGITIPDRRDEVKLSAALAKLHDEDPSLVIEHKSEGQELRLLGQGEMHLRVTLEKLARKFGISANRRPMQVPYRETIRKPTRIRGKHKKQSGGHGQFGDCVLEIRPQARGAGFLFEEAIVGGAIPRQFIPSVEMGVVEALESGPLGFPVVDVAVTVLDGSHHSVDSSDMAFRQAGRVAIADGLPACNPVLLEPVMRVQIFTPSGGTPSITAMIPQHRGQILRLEPREGWKGWDCVTAAIPEAEMDGLIIEVRSVTSGVGTFTASFDHLAELTGKLADHVLQSRAQAAE